MKGQNGFTIIELLTVMTIMCLLAAISIPAVKAFSRSADIKSCATQIVADMWYARQRAIATSEPYSVLFEASHNRYKIFRDDGDGLAANAANGQIDSGEQVLATKTIDARFHMSDVNLNPANVAIFMPKGSLKTGTGGGYVTIRSDRGSRTVLIRASGMCKVD